jgi:threonine aldolase
VFDLRSDTVTRPTPAMRQAMATAEVGDDVYREDPTVRELEEQTAAIVGKEASLFVPSGTMANQIALLCHTRPGDEVIAGRNAHCISFESGAGAAWSGVQFAQTAGELFGAEDAAALIRPAAYYCPRTRLIAIENTHNMAGGRVFPRADVEAIASLAKEKKLALHLDGARLWNAAVATGAPETELAAPFDSVSVCFSKGLGAPLGSAICGSRALIDDALRFRKMLGGGMRQAGVLAAAALYALEHHRKRLDEDHRAASQLASALADIDGVSVGPVETNIVIATVEGAERVVAVGKEKGVLFSALSSRSIRFVTHLDVSGPRFGEAISAVVAAFRGARHG